MTLLATEIHNHDDPTNAFIVFAADRRITLENGGYGGTRKKVFELPLLTGAVGYFGLAEVVDGQKQKPMQDWLRNFIHRTADSPTLREFAERLASALNAAVPSGWKQTVRSGFHIAGFNAAGEPEFWFVRNIDDNGEPTLREYKAREDFQRRDARRLSPGSVMIYRNGDLRPHEAAWTKLDESLGRLLQVPGFRQVRSPVDYKEWVRFKMEVIAYFYKKYHPHPIIARPIDVILLRSSHS
jgi:hypothetical protein